MATYICHKWRCVSRVNRPVVSAPTIVHRTPMSYTETDLYDSLKLAYGANIQVSLKHIHHTFSLSIQPIAPSKNPNTKPVFSLTKIKPIYDFMKRWGQDVYIIKLLDVSAGAATEIPLPMYYSIKDPSNL